MDIRFIPQKRFMTLQTQGQIINYPYSNVDIDTQIQICLAEFVSRYAGDVALDDLESYGYHLEKLNDYNFKLTGKGL